MLHGWGGTASVARPIRFGIGCSLSLLSLFVAGFSFSAPAQEPVIATSFSFPLGFTDGQSYAPRLNYDNGSLIEDTGFDAQNPDLAPYSDFRRIAHGRPAAVCAPKALEVPRRC